VYMIKLGRIDDLRGFSSNGIWQGSGSLETTKHYGADLESAWQNAVSVGGQDLAKESSKLHGNWKDNMALSKQSDKIWWLQLW
ncbi:unnamed protein product, partial [Ilex paraguariensis]